MARAMASELPSQSSQSSSGEASSRFARHLAGPEGAQGGHPADKKVESRLLSFHFPCQH